jgi:hypothetical protein
MVDSKPFFVTWHKARLPPPSRASNSIGDPSAASASQFSEIGAADSSTDNEWERINVIRN